MECPLRRGGDETRVLPIRDHNPQLAVFHHVLSLNFAKIRSYAARGHIRIRIRIRKIPHPMIAHEPAMLGSSPHSGFPGSQQEALSRLDCSVAERVTVLDKKSEGQYSLLIMKSTISSKGQVTVPVEIRERLGLRSPREAE